MSIPRLLFKVREMSEQKCPNCRTPIEKPVARTIFLRRQGKVVQEKKEFCSKECGGRYQMAHEG